MKKNIIILLLILCIPAVAFSEPAAITVDGGKNSGQVNPLIWGTNLISDSDSGEGVWVAEKNIANSEMVKDTIKAGIKFLRFPGGCIAHNYRWKDAIGPVKKRPVTISIFGHTHHNKFGIAEFINFCRQVNAEPIMTVSYFVDGPKEAADLVEYCNGSISTFYGALRKTHGYPEPFNIKYWEIGNEVWHGNAAPHQNLSLHAVTPTNYAYRFKTFSKLMRKRDPSILIGAVGMEMGLKDLDSFALFWNRNLIEIARKDIDFISLHQYLPGYQTNPSNDPVSHFKALMAVANQTVYNINELQLLWKKLASISENNNPLKIAYTEYHAGFLSKERFSWGGALYVADFITMMLSPYNNVIGSNYMEQSNGFWGMFKGINTIKMRPDAEMFCLLSQNIGKQILPVKVSSPSFEPPDVGFIHSTKTVVSGVNTLSGNNLITDSGFEKGTFSEPWSYMPIRGAKVKIDSTIKHSGNNSVMIDFDGSRDVNFLQVFQPVDLVPGNIYRLSGYIRTVDLKDVNGVSIALMDANDYKLFNVFTQSLSGDNNWTWVEKIFKVPAKVTKCFLMLRRFEGGGKVSGKAWFDDISIEKYNSHPMKKPLVLSAFTTESANDDEIILWVINRDPTQSVDTNLLLSNVKWIYDKCRLKTIQGNGIGTNALFAKEMEITDTEKVVAENMMKHKFPPASLSILSFVKKDPDLQPPTNIMLH